MAALATRQTGDGVRRVTVTRRPRLDGVRLFVVRVYAANRPAAERGRVILEA
jgi:hypothetical protein